MDVGINGYNIMAKKSTDAEVELRVATIYEMVVKAVPRKNIIRYASENWDISSRTVDEYLKRVYLEIKETYGDSYRQNILEKSLAQIDDLYVKCYTIEDYRECRNLIESKSKLLGLNEALKIDQNISITDFDITKLYDPKKAR